MQLTAHGSQLIVYRKEKDNNLDRIYRIFSLFPEERVKPPISAYAERKI